MLMDVVRGSGGGGKSGSSGGGISQDPDTLSSVATARFVDLIGEGLIGGLVNGEYSIYLDGVPLRDLSGTPNYKPFTWVANNGSQVQDVLPGFAGTESETAVSVPLTVSAGTVVRTISDTGADAVRVTLSVQGLSNTDDKGHVSGTSVLYTIQVRVSGGTWQTAVNGNIDGKTSARYQRSHLISLAGIGTGPFEVSVTRVTADSTSALLINGLYWDTYTVLNYEKLTYPNSACIGVQIDARYFSSVPARSYHVKGLIVRVPSNYDPVARSYSGSWDGTWQLAYTNNPAWCYYDLVTNPRYGLGKRITDAQISKWTMYKIAQYCDQLVPTGLQTNVYDLLGGSATMGADGTPRASIPYRTGPMEPRFTLNVVINTLDDAFKVLNNMASVFRGMTYWASGSVMLTQDSPGNPSMLWNNANVIDGAFTYEGSSRAQRHTVALVGWNDPSEDFKQKFEYVEDKEGIVRYGVRQDQVIAFGCTSRSQARRLGLYILLTERLEKDAIKFRAGLDSARVRPGDVGIIMDKRRFGTRWGGRVISTTTNSVTVDAPVTLPVGGAYTFNVMGRDGTIKTSTVNIGTGGAFVTFTFADTTFTSNFGPMAIWTMASATVSPMQVRVINVLQVDASTFEITVVENNPSKYDAIDQGAFVQPDSYSFLTTQVGAVTGLVSYEDTYTPVNSSVSRVGLGASWDHPIGALARGYQVKVTSANGYIRPMQEQAEPSLDLYDINPDTYTISVAMVNYLGAVGPVSTTTRTIIGIDTKPPGDVTGFTATSQTGGILLTWDKLTELDYKETEIHVETTWHNITPPLVKLNATSWVWTWPAAGSYTLQIKHRDTSGNLSANAAHLDLVVGTNTLIQAGSLAPGAVTSGNIATGAVDTPGISANAVTLPAYTFQSSFIATVPTGDTQSSLERSSNYAVIVNNSPTETFAVDISANWSQTWHVYGPNGSGVGEDPPIVWFYLSTRIVHADSTVSFPYNSPGVSEDLYGPATFGVDIFQSVAALVNIGPGDTMYVSVIILFYKGTDSSNNLLSTYEGSSFSLKNLEIRTTALKR